MCINIYIKAKFCKQTVELYKHTSQSNPINIGKASQIFAFPLNSYRTIHIMVPETQPRNIHVILSCCENHTINHILEVFIHPQQIYNYLHDN